MVPGVPLLGVPVVVAVRLVMLGTAVLVVLITT
jgi:hypothetical protein